MVPWNFRHQMHSTFTNIVHCDLVHRIMHHIRTTVPLESSLSGRCGNSNILGLEIKFIEYINITSKLLLSFIFDANFTYIVFFTFISRRDFALSSALHGPNARKIIYIHLELPPTIFQAVCQCATMTGEEVRQDGMFLQRNRGDKSICCCTWTCICNTLMDLILLSLLDTRSSSCILLLRNVSQQHHKLLAG